MKYYCSTVPETQVAPCLWSTRSWELPEQFNEKLLMQLFLKEMWKPGRWSLNHRSCFFQLKILALHTLYTFLKTRVFPAVIKKAKCNYSNIITPQRVQSIVSDIPIGVVLFLLISSFDFYFALVSENKFKQTSARRKMDQVLQDILRMMIFKSINQLQQL